MIARLAFAGLAIALLAGGTAVADDWPGPVVKAAVSTNAQIVVRVIPGESVGDTYGFAGAPKGKYASAQWYRFREDRYELYQTAQLVNPVAPVHVAVANDGSVIALDNWHNAGYGDVVAIYAPEGKLRKRYRLEDLYSTASIGKIGRSVSSIWWRCSRGDPQVDRDNTLQVDDALDGRFTFNLATGAYRYEAGAGKCKK
jgi:hypothetical protein